MSRFRNCRPSREDDTKDPAVSAEDTVPPRQNSELPTIQKFNQSVAIISASFPSLGSALMQAEVVGIFRHRTELQTQG